MAPLAPPVPTPMAAGIGTHLFVECMQLFDKRTNPYILF